jgi:RNA polymerase sigma-70 factor (ECF subfamily)
LKDVEPKAPAWTTLSDEEVVRRVCAGESGLFELLMRRYNQRVYRVGRSILRDDAEAEELAQETWVRAYTHLSQFERRSRFSTWLTRIAYHRAWAHSSDRRRFKSLDTQAIRRKRDREAASSPDPEMEASRRQLRTVLEKAVDALPLPYRTVFMLREVEEMSTQETAQSLGLTQATVKVRLHRARALLRRELLDRADDRLQQIFLFLGNRCDRLVNSVKARLDDISALTQRRVVH